MLVKPPGEVAVPPAKDSSKPRRRRKKREKDVFDVMEGIFGAVILGALEYSQTTTFSPPAFLHFASRAPYSLVGSRYMECRWS